MNRIKEIVKSNKFLRGFYLQHRISKDNNFEQWIKDYDECCSMVKFQEFGNKNKDKNIYLMKFDDSAMGFFAYWRFSIIGLAFAERYNMVPVIDWTDKGPYYEKNGVNGIKNPFEYYYYPVSEVSVEDVNESYNVSYYSRNSNGISNIKYGNEENLEVDYIYFNRKYMKLKEDVQLKIDEQVKKLLNNKKTLAVQVRGVEWGNIKGHPIPLSLEKYTEEIDKAIELYGFEQIFLATDSEDTIEYLDNKYKGKIVFYNDVARASKGSKTLAIFDPNIKRENNNYLMGFEVLRDMLTLSYCDGLIAGYSNISFAADISKKSRDEEYIYKLIFKQELNKNGMDAGKAVKLMKENKY